jgi:hypothetical protein
LFEQLPDTEEQANSASARSSTRNQPGRMW